MENVVIVAKTHTYENRWCVGALVLSSNRGLRLFTSLGVHQPQDTPFEVGQIWEMSWRREYSPQPPHIEDVRVIEQRYIGSISGLAHPQNSLVGALSCMVALPSSVDPPVYQGAVPDFGCLINPFC